MLKIILRGVMIVLLRLRAQKKWVGCKQNKEEKIKSFLT